MKRIITLLLAVSVLFTFAACTKTENTDPTADASNTGVPNPMTEITAEEMEFDVNVPEGAEDVKYFVIEDGDSKMDQVSYTLDGKDYCYRMQSTSEVASYDMSGVYADKWENEDAEVSYCDAVVKTGSEGSVIYWLDVVPGINYTLSCSQKLTAAEISEAAAALFVPMQGDADADEEFPTFAESHYEDGDYNTVDVEYTGENAYNVVIGLYRLANLEGEGSWVEGSLKFTAEAPDGSSITGRFFPSVDADGFSLCFTDSKWDLLEGGTTFEGFLPKVETADEEIPEGHYEDGNNNTVDVEYAGMNVYSVAIGLYRLTSLEGEGSWVEGSLKFTAEAPDGSSITGRFFPSVDAEGFSLCFTDSKWDLLEGGTTFEGFLPTEGTQGVGVPNPMTEITAEEMEFDVNVPEGAEDVKYFVIEDGDSKMDQVSYTLNGKDYCYRMQSTSEVASYDMSGIYADKWETEDAKVSYCDAVVKTCSEGSVIYWLDVVPGVNYTLSCSQKLTAAEISEAAAALFVPMQGDAE